MQCIQHSKTCSIYSWVAEFLLLQLLLMLERSINSFAVLMQPLKTFHALLNCNAYLMTRKQRVTQGKNHFKIRQKRLSFWNSIRNSESIFQNLKDGIIRQTRLQIARTFNFRCPKLTLFVMVSGYCGPRVTRHLFCDICRRTFFFKSDAKGPIFRGRISIKHANIANIANVNLATWNLRILSIYF